MVGGKFLSLIKRDVVRTSLDFKQGWKTGKISGICKNVKASNNIIPAIGGGIFLAVSPLMTGPFFFPIGVAFGSCIKHAIKSKTVVRLAQKMKSAVKLNILG